MQQEDMRTYSLSEANTFFAKSYNGACWSLLSKTDRTPDDTAKMINLAHASLQHWEENKEGTPANRQRGEFLISTAYALAGRKEPALYHAKRCLEHTLCNPESMMDFDVPYAYMAMARASALAGNENEAKEYLSKMIDAAGRTKNEVDMQFFVDDLRMGDWSFAADHVAGIANAYGQGRPKNNT